jgi:Tol biopolymer transport system component
MRRRSGFVALVAVFSAGSLSGCNPPQPWDIALMSAGPHGEAANGTSYQSVISPDGTKVAFQGTATNLVPNAGTNHDVFVRDLTTGRVELVSADPAGRAIGSSYGPVFSRDGTKVLFQNYAEDVVPGDGPGFDVFLRDLTAGTTTLVSTEGPQPHSDTRQLEAGFSPDGSKVIYSNQDVYLYDIPTGETTLVSVTASGEGPGDGESFGGVVSPDGTSVAFASAATDLGPTDTNGAPDIYLRDLVAGTTSLLSSNGAEPANGGSFQPVFSPDGTRLVFRSDASNLGPTDTNHADDIYALDLAAPGDVILVSANGTGTDSGNAPSGALDGPSFTPDGSILFDSLADDLGATDTNGTHDVYLRDLAEGRTELISTNDAGTDTGNAWSATARPAANGRIIFNSAADDLGPADHNDVPDVYVRDLRTHTTTLVSRTPNNAAGNRRSLMANGPPSQVLQVVSDDGRRVVFDSEADNLVPEDNNRTTDVFVAMFEAADLALTADAQPDPVATGHQVRYHLQVTNAGPDQPDEATLTVLLADGTLYTAVDATGGSCTPPTPGAPQLVTCHFDHVPTGELATVIVTATVTAPADTTLQTLAATASPLVDLDRRNNTTLIESTVTAN